jgi:hypothetical protein
MLSHSVIIALVPGCVEVAKRSGLPSRFAPLAAVLIAVLLVALSTQAGDADLLDAAAVAKIALGGLIDGLAAIGLYHVVPSPEPAP